MRARRSAAAARSFAAATKPCGKERSKSRARSTTKTNSMQPWPRSDVGARESTFGSGLRARTPRRAGSGLRALDRGRLAPADALLDDDRLVERDVGEAVGLARRRPVDLEFGDAPGLAEPHLLLEAVPAGARVAADEGEDVARAGRLLALRADADAVAEAVGLVAD